MNAPSTGAEIDRRPAAWRANGVAKRRRLNAFFAISVNSPPMSMVNFSCCVGSVPGARARGRNPESSPSADACGSSNGSRGPMLSYDQPIVQARPEGPPRSAAGPRRLQPARTDAAVVAAEGRDRDGGPDLGLRRDRDRQEPDAEILRDRPALCRSPRTATGRSRTHAAQPGPLRPRHGGREPGPPDHFEQRPVADDPGHPSRPGPGVRRPVAGRADVAARPVRAGFPLRCGSQGRRDGGAGNPGPPCQCQEDRPQLHRRCRSLVR